MLLHLLLIILPICMQVVYFVNSGSEANDMAMMLARTYTGNWDLICLRNAYHGMSIATMGTCGQHTWKQPMPQGFGVHHALNPDPYRGVFGNDGKKWVVWRLRCCYVASMQGLELALNAILFVAWDAGIARQSGLRVMSVNASCPVGCKPYSMRCRKHAQRHGQCFPQGLW